MVTVFAVKLLLVYSGQVLSVMCRKAMSSAQDFTGGYRMVLPAPGSSIKGSNEQKVTLFGLMLTVRLFFWALHAYLSKTGKIM